jgi:alpha-L-arabinofuranosidase
MIREASAEKPAGAMNEGFWGIKVVAGAKYRLTFWAKAAPGFQGKLRPRLLSKNGKEVLASSQEMIRPDAAWKKYTATLTAVSSDPEGRFALVSDTPGTVWLDMVSLFPATWKNRANGMRPDLAETIAALKPAFLRFPGGSFVSEHNVDFAPRWKKTIGPIEQRPTRYGLHWGYHSTEGLGLFEYLQFAEDLGAEPIFCITSGNSNQKQITGPALDEYMQDALDAIAFANAPANTEWGRKRAEMGHPAPFNLKIIQIGNEQYQTEYPGNFKRFYDAIKASYPAIKMIYSGYGSTCSIPYNGKLPVGKPYFPTDLKADYTAEHYYKDIPSMLAESLRFAKYERDGMGIFISELASAPNNLHAAIAEAAFDLRCEANSDKVAMVSYAPLLDNTCATNWGTCLIHFNQATLYLTPNYHVQQMLSLYRGDWNLATVVEGAEDVQEKLVVANATRNESTGETFVKLLNAGPRPVTVTVRVNGLSVGNHEVTLIRLASTNPKDTNSFQEPARIKPVTSALRLARPTSAVELPAVSFSIYRIK